MRAGLTILLLLLAIATAKSDEEEFVVLDDGSRIPIRKAIPVVPDSRFGQASSFRTSTTPSRVESNLNNGIRTNHHGVRVDYRIKPQQSPEIGFNLNAGFKLLDSMTGESLDPTLSRNLQISQGGHLQWTGPNKLELKLSAGLETLARDSQAVTEYATYRRTQLSYTPIRNSTIRSSFATIDRQRLDGLLINEENISNSLEQRLPPLPLRLTLTQSATWQSLQDASAGDLERHRLLASALWSFDSSNSLSFGMESSMISREALASTQSTSIAFTELRIEPAPRFGLHLRATAEERNHSNSASHENSSHIFVPSLSAGIDIQLSPRFETGIGVLYRPNPPSTPSNPTPSPTRITIFGSALF